MKTTGDESGSTRASVKFTGNGTGNKILLEQNKMVARGGIFGAVRRPRNYQERLKLSDLADTEIIERFRLSRGRINWLVERFRDLERDTARSCPLSSETQVKHFSLKFIGMHSLLTIILSVGRVAELSQKKRS